MAIQVMEFQVRDTKSVFHLRMNVFIGNFRFFFLKMIRDS